MKLFFKIFFYTASLVYPLVVFLSLVILDVPVRIFSLFVIFVALVYILAATANSKKSPVKRSNIKLFVSAGVLFTGGVVCLLTGRTLFIKLYPVIINGIFLFTFGSTLFCPPNICFRFACLQDKKLAASLASRRVEAYCKRVTLIWCLFFILNGSIALYTVFFAGDKLWSLYNGGISYACMGILFTIEFLVRRVVNSKMPKAIPISKFNAYSHPMDMVMCYEHKWSDGHYLTWSDFLWDSAKIRAFIRKHDDIDRWILHCEDYWFFMCSFIALLQCNKEVLLTANISPVFISEIRTDKNTGFLTDRRKVDGKPIHDAYFISDVLANEDIPADTELENTPAIVADDTKIVMYTSGSTGHPKAVKQRMTEFEEDNAFIISKWGEEFLSRRLCATVSQHHIYGFLFTISLPFALGVPFRRTRIEFPDEFKSLDDDSYMIIAVPAFLKRTNMELEGEKLPLKSPWIFTSGGVLLPEVAKETDSVFGFWPVEVYGSTETSGIAYRQSKNGLEWTPFDNAKIWKNENGCLTIISPYIKDPSGFATGDLVEIHDDGKFLLKGRADSIVKIEEKRISLTEVENRILNTGLVSDCSVVPMSDRRQYLAAAIVLNADGKEKFKDTEKYLINRFFHDYLLQFFENVVIPKKWRFLESIPVDVQGKKKKPVIQKLFAPANAHGIPAETVLRRTDSEVELEVEIPRTSDYFDGHFPDFKIFPAVAQIDLLVHFVQRYFGLDLAVPEIKRFKFSDKILPDAVVVFRISYDSIKKQVSFKISDYSEIVLYSSGSYKVL